MPLDKESGSETNLKDAQELQDLITKRSSVKGQITKLIQKFVSSNPDANEHPASNEPSALRCEHQGANFELPQIQIVKFDGAYFRWLEFRDTFVSLIHNNNRIAPIHKFHYLLAYLAGDASNVVANLEVSDANYSAAWKLLCERYDNKRQLITHHLNSLLNLQQLTRESDKSLRFMVDHITKNLRALSSLGQPTDQWDVLVVHILSLKLDSRTHIKWEEWRGTLSDMPDLKQFQRFLIDRADVLESLNRTTSNTNKNVKPFGTANKIEHPKTNSFACINHNDGKGDESSYSCSFCRGDHRIYDCANFKALSVQDRISTANKLRLCLNCLRYGHKVHSCRLGPCRDCKKRHNTLLHIPVHNTSNSNKGSKEIAAFETVASLSNQDYSQVLLSTALINISNPLTSQSLNVRALLDCGSQSSFITQSLKDKLHLQANSSDIINIVGIGDNETSNLIETCTAQLTSLTEPFKITQSFLVLPKLTGDLPKCTIDAKQFQLPKNTQLVDPSFNKSTPVDILIGAEIFWDIIGDKQSSLGPHGPKLRSSKFGWLISGPTYNNVLPKSRSIQCHQSNASINFKSINQQLARFRELEEIPPKHFTLSPSERECEAHFQPNTHRLESGRFSVGLPRIDNPDCLGDSYHLAKKRLLQLEKRFSKNPDIKAQYVNFIREYAELGHLTEAPVAKPVSSYFLCHHAVFKNESESTKIRVVFDGSAPTSSGYSINDILMVGPNLQDSLFSMLIRARQHKYLLTGDEEKMYRQFLVNEEDRPLQLILWREDESTLIKTLMLNTVTYGMASSSYLSTRCLWQLGEECEDDTIKTIIQHDFMVDDLITGSDSEDMIIYIQQAVMRALKRGCLNLRKFKSNLPSLLSAFPLVESNLLFSESTSTLGIGWEPSTDELFFPIQRAVPTHNAKSTKRSMLSSLFKIFDPLGLMSPCIVQSKFLLQRLWSEKIDWDEAVPNDVQNSWCKFTLALPVLLEIKIPRRTICDNPISIELHSFSDASQHAYGACIYLKSTNCYKEATVALLCSKSKVAPIKPTTIPRLELCASLLAANLCKAVLKSLRCEINRKVHWCDSSVVLGWLKTSPQALKTFVANRVAEICDLTDASSWRLTSKMPLDKESGSETNLKDAQELQDLITKRSSVKGQITKFKNSLALLLAKDSLTSVEVTELTLRLRRFESLTSRFDELQNQIEVLNSSNLQGEIDERDYFEQSFINNIALAQRLIQKFVSSNPDANEHPAANEPSALH
ncbi:uncharacterized protein LOC118753418, partial [Rhagoletis pomonella]|uniref:uncharacterized protein LOC118753418 n=1 Tax=Rhagoletis pomonella TaxID=28610 RepID=UPI0017800456